MPINNVIEETSIQGVGGGNQHHINPMFSFYSDTFQGFSPILIKPQASGLPKS